jgi:hypothetical protein
MDKVKLDTVCYVLAHCQFQIDFLNDYDNSHFLFYDEWGQFWDRLEEIYEGEIEPNDDDVSVVNKSFDQAVALDLISEVSDLISK